MEIIFDKVSYFYSEGLSLEKEALKNVSVKFKKGKINAIIGNSGSGKTTMLELINALLLPSSGKISVGDFELKKGKKLKNINKLRFDVGLIFQFPEEQFFQPTVKKEIEFGMKYFKYRLNNSDKRINDALKMVGLDETYLDRSPFALSLGEQRKVAIASILAFNPKVVILDEPTVGLDNKSKKSLISLIRKLKNRYNKTVIIVSHDVDLLYQISDNFIILDKGKVIKTGDKETIYDDIAKFEKQGMNIPRVVKFIKMVEKEKGIKLDPYDNIKDLIKSVYRNV